MRSPGFPTPVRRPLGCPARTRTPLSSTRRTENDESSRRAPNRRRSANRRGWFDGEGVFFFFYDPRASGKFSGSRHDGRRTVRCAYIGFKMHLCALRLAKDWPIVRNSIKKRTRPGRRVRRINIVVRVRVRRCSPYIVRVQLPFPYAYISFTFECNPPAVRRYGPNHRRRRGSATTPVVINTPRYSFGLAGSIRVFRNFVIVDACPVCVRARGFPY